MPSLARARFLPWWLLYELVTVANAQWKELTESDRERLRRLVLDSHGWPGNLTTSERREVQRIVSKIDLKRIAFDLVPAVGRRTRK
ncbi:MAG: hypothetical protein ACR2ND_10075 [Solirubrobacteraceae bacterium]